MIMPTAFSSSNCNNASSRLFRGPAVLLLISGLASSVLCDQAAASREVFVPLRQQKVVSLHAHDDAYGGENHATALFENAPEGGKCPDASPGETHCVYGKLTKDFCQKTGQDDWCSTEKLGSPWCFCWHRVVMLEGDWASQIGYEPGKSGKGCQSKEEVDALGRGQQQYKDVDRQLPFSENHE